MNTLMKWLTYKEVVVKRKRNHKHNKTAWIKTINRYSPEIALELIEEIYFELNTKIIILVLNLS